MMTNNLKAKWVPRFVQEKRFHNWLADARDWAISRNRYWGTPMPIWESQDKSQIVVISSIEQLKELTGEDVTDLHRDSIDDYLIPDPRGEAFPPLKRIKPVFDCWFESGSMPYAQSHYPFENKDKFEGSFPADFIAEGLDQTRGWFYTLLVLSTALFDEPASKNVIVNGLILAEDGTKMSKSKKNYPPVTDILGKHGADALRMYLVNSPAVRAEPLKFRADGVKDVVKDVLLKLFNSYRFFGQQLERHDLTSGSAFVPSMAPSPTNVMDRWVLAELAALQTFITAEMEGYRLYNVMPRLVLFIEDLTNWYIRLNRPRLKGDAGVEDQRSSLDVLYYVLFMLCRMLSPFVPFIVESFYLNLRNLLPEGHELHVPSVHFLDFPTIPEVYTDAKVVASIDALKKVVVLGRKCRDQNALSLKTPLASVTVCHADEEYLGYIETLKPFVKMELNVLDLETSTKDAEFATYSVKPDLKALGRRLGGKMRPIAAALSNLNHEEIVSLRDNGAVTVLGTEVSLSEVAVEVNARPDLKDVALSAEGPLLIAYSTESTPVLAAMGFARLISSSVQKLRKREGLNLTDSVVVHVTATEEALADVLQYLPGAMSEGIVLGAALPEDMPSMSVEIKGEAVSVGIKLIA
ncbi:hypothetical protein KIPB_010467 [Kipferlia bialata]|uniref:isoleucine--tRNA ligase n=1 Tax=Kipferlia bialata TaxID=797122 RepID=A0A9K3D3W9_9EUKA|nr:hypothetical protein KIPB_010467 [Kipferlia bialata]|eukprot:g10467.t1